MLSYEDARAACTSDGADLATVGLAGENRILADLFTSGRAWIGLRYDVAARTWGWENDAVLLYDGWGPAFPASSVGQPLGLMLPAGAWNNVPPNIAGASYLCERTTYPRWLR